MDKTFARMVNGQAIDVMTDDPKTIFHPDLAATFVEVPDGTGNGDTLVGGKWTKYAQPEPSPVVVTPPVVTPPQFKILILPELARIYAKVEGDPAIKAFVSVIDDPRLTEVNLGLGTVRGGLEYALGAIGLTAAEIEARMAEVMTGAIA